MCFWCAAATAGVVAGVTGLLVSRVRREALFTAGVGFGIAGVLGILSIGILFLGLAAVCFVKAASEPRLRSPQAPTGSVPSDHKGEET